MTEAEYKAEYERLEALAESGAMTWRGAMAAVALLTLRYTRERCENVKPQVPPGEPFGISLTPDDAAIFFGLENVDGSPRKDTAT